MLYSNVISIFIIRFIIRVLSDQLLYYYVKIIYFGYESKVRYRGKVVRLEVHWVDVMTEAPESDTSTFHIFLDFKTFSSGEDLVCYSILNYSCFKYSRSCDVRVARIVYPPQLDITIYSWYQV